MGSRHPAGRPPATSHAQIESAAFDLFARQGFEQTTLEDIAESVHVGRRTLFRYFPSKNDIPWGRFDESLARFKLTLNQMPTDNPVFDAVHKGIIDFNRLDDEIVPQHRVRMALILRTPALQAHSVLRYAQWRAVIADYVAARLLVPADSLLPRTMGQVSLALALSAYEQWLDFEGESLEENLVLAGDALRHFIDPHA